MKRLITLLICFTLFCCFTGCRLGKQNKDVVDKNFYCKVIDENNIAIGAVELKLNGYTNKTKRDDECELGYWLGQPFWGRGYMPEAAREMIRHGFEDLGMNTIWCGYFEGNQKSKRVQEKIGFVYHHTREKVSVPLMKEVRTEHRNIMTKERWMAEREKNCGKV